MGKNTKARERFAAMPFWRRAERTVAQMLRLHGIPCKLIARENRGWDVETTKARLRIEVKAARLLRHRKKNHLTRSPFWAVSIARQHRLREDCDFYVIRLLGDDLRKIYLILPAPLRTKMLQVTFLQLLTKYRDNVNAWHLIQDADRDASLGLLKKSVQLVNSGSEPSPARKDGQCAA